MNGITAARTLGRVLDHGKPDDMRALIAYIRGRGPAAVRHIRTFARLVLDTFPS